MESQNMVAGDRLDVQSQTGYFLFSLDTELAWGYFDLDRIRSKKFSLDGSRERKSIELLLDILGEFDITATWAVVGHLFYEKCERCDICPVLEWQGRYRSFEEVYGTDNPLWYGADIIETLLTKGAQHEIAFHGYTHRVFDESTMSAEEARVEIREWMRLSKRKSFVPQTVIFPRDRIGHLDLFKEAGFICYRSDVNLPLMVRNKYWVRYIKHIDHILSLSSPPVYQLSELYDGSSGLMNFRTSQHIFGFNRRLETILDALSLHRLRINRMIKGIKKAADEKKVIHVWAHPWEFRTGKDFEKLRYLFSCVADEISKGKMQSVGMAELARKAMELDVR